jgi:LmbE family N-acetylglucosaminyl deacetylase
MWLSRNVCQFTIATIASRSNFTSYFYTLDRDFFDIDTVSSLRTAEGSVAARLLGGRYLPLGQAEATVRYRDTRWTLDSFRNHQLSIRVATGRIYGEAELRDWTSAITKLLREQEADEVWMPLGVGVHCDHQLARDACLDALIAEPSLFDNRTVKFYQEVPYGARNPNYTSKVVAALERGGASLVPESVPIDEVFDQKLRVISIYGSQFKLDVLRPEIESNARMAGGAAHMAELFWRLDAAPKKRDRLSMYVHEEAVRKTMPRLSSWCSRHRSSKRIRIMLLVPSGKWAMDADQLLRLFPRATFDVYVSSAGLAEVNEVPSPRIRARRVGMGMKAWGSLAAKLVVARPMPTLFVTGAKRLTIGRALRLLWPLNDTVVLPSMDYVVLGLRRPIDYKPL